MLNRFVAILLASLVCVFPASNAMAAERLVIYAASSLTDALTEIADAYEAESEHQMVLSFASSSALARQVESVPLGDVYISANDDWIDYLASGGYLVPSSVRTVARNRLVFASSVLTESAETKEEFTQILDHHLGPDDRMALADPAHVPAGIYGEQAMAFLGLWDSYKGRAAVTDNVRAALALIERGEVVGGIVYESDLRVVETVQPVFIFPQESHEPIRYSAGALANAHPAGEQFLDHLTTEPAQKILQSHGFIAP